jgi:prephenate dehydrogenase
MFNNDTERRVKSLEKIRSVGIVGLGSFGRFVAGLAPPDVRILGCDPAGRTAPGILRAGAGEVLAADVVILAIPLASYPVVLADVKAALRPETLVMDVCSVKQVPEELFGQYLPHHENILLTHPLFGPQSAAAGTRGHTMIVTKSQGARAGRVLEFCEQTLGLEVRRMSGEAHDQTMAQVQALTFFVARGLADMGLGRALFTTPSYGMIADLMLFDATHTDALFQTVERGNRFAADMRRQLIESLTRTDKGLGA